MKYLALVLVPLLLLTIPGNAQTPDETTTPVKHVIVIVQENHSFDNYFGTYPSANGTLKGDVISRLQRVNGLPNNVCLPYGAGCLSPYPANSTNTNNPIEGRDIYELDYNNGKMDGFAIHSGPQSMAYFDYRQIPAYWDYAEEYSLGDNYFASAMTTTTPNRLFMLSGDAVVSSNYGPPPYAPFNGTILGQLSSKGITWGYFDYLQSYANQANVYPLNYISGIRQSDLSQVKDVSSFLQSLSNESNLPSVSFVNALGLDTLDEHPPFNSTAGESWTVSLVNAVMCSQYWTSSVIIFTYDEGGGYYDHVPPPQVFEINHSFDRPLRGYGQRVPLLVISPFAKENYVSNTLLNHMSILRFIDYNWNLPALNENVANSNNLLDFFNFTGTPRAPVILGDNGPYSAKVFPIPLQNESDQSINSNTCGAQTKAPSISFPYLLLVPLVVGVMLATAVLRRKATRRSRSSSQSYVQSHRSCNDDDHGDSII